MLARAIKRAYLARYAVREAVLCAADASSRES
jgi:hypothetical protein